MNKNEKKLFIQLCSLKSASREKLAHLIDSGAATANVLGLLFENRMAAVAFDVLSQTNLLNRTNREFRNSLRNASLVGMKQNEIFEECLIMVSKILDSCSVSYALLKGAYLFGKYPGGTRTSNDIDVLVAPENVESVSRKLRDAGFEQGHLQNGEFIAATRQQIVESKMTRGETVPFIKRIDSPFLKYLEVDINFSLDYKNGDADVLRSMLARTRRVTVGNATICTLNAYDFFLHLCIHLYKEATTMPWILMKRDMTFYKYCDIYMLLHDYSSNDAKELIKRAEIYGAERELLYCLKSVHSFFKVRQPLLRGYLDQNDVDLEYVVAPAEQKRYRYKETKPIIRFFKNDRLKLLEEVTI